MLLVPHRPVASTDWLLLCRPLGVVLLFCQELTRVWGLSGRCLGETTQVENGSFCLAAFPCKQRPVPNAGLVLQRDEAGFLPRSWVSPVLPVSTVYRLAKAAFIMHMCYTNIPTGINHRPAVKQQGDSWESPRNGVGHQRPLHW